MTSARVLTIGKGSKPFTLPLQLETTTQAILARKRSGKSYTAAVEAEELIEAGEQIGVIDPTSAWFGLRASADGKRKGYPVVIFGGDHADAPLNFRTGKAMAAALVDHSFSAIYDIGDLEFDEQVEFVRDFCAELLRRNRKPLHLFMDEADSFAPQLLESKLQKQCLGTVSRVVKQGGVKGLGFTMISQRPADINKKVLSQVEMLTVLRMSHSLDIAPVVDWIRRSVNEEFALEVEAALPKLPVGEGFFCSDSLGIGGQLVKIRRRRTFDSGATPKVGEVRAEPKMLAPIDIAKLGKEIAASVEKLKQESPEFLMRQVAELKAQLAKVPTKGGKADMGFMEEAQAAHEELERLRLEHAELERLREENAEIPAMQARLKLYEEGVKGLRESFDRLFSTLIDVGVVERPRPALVWTGDNGVTAQRMREATRPMPREPAAARAALAQGEAAEASGLSGPARRILEALGRFHAIGVYAPPRIQVCIFSGYGNLSSTGFVKAMGSLRTAGLVQYPGDGTVSLTDEGIRIAPASDPIRSDAELLEAINGTLGGPEQKILAELVAYYPNSVSREVVMTAAGYSNLSSTGFVKAMGRLRSLGYADYPSPGNVVATAQCFLPGRS